MASILVTTQAFRVPCRTFWIRLSVARNERLPLVKEFALRVLKALGRCEYAHLQGFFGFSDREMGVMLRDLADAGLVTLFDQQVELSEGALGLFNYTEEGAPFLQRVETWNEKFAIDFVSFSLIRPQAANEDAKSVHEIESTDYEKVSRARDIAREVFAESFYEFLDKQKSTTISAEDRVGLNIYGISKIEPKNTFTFPLQVRLFVDTDLPGRVRHEYPEFATDADQDKRERLVNEVARKLEIAKTRSVLGRRPHWLFNERLGDQGVGKHCTSESFNLAEYLNGVTEIDQVEDRSPETKSIVGPLLSEGNIDVLVEMLRSKVTDDPADAERTISNTMFWQKPCNEFWARDGEALRALSTLRSEVSKATGGKSKIKLVFDTEYDKPDEINFRFRRKNNKRVFEEGIGLRLHEEMRAVEAFVLPGVIGGVVYYYLEDDGSEMPVPIGIVTRDTEKLRRLTELLLFQWTSYKRKITRYWPTKGGRNEENVEGGDVFTELHPHQTEDSGTNNRPTLSLNKNNQ